MTNAQVIFETLNHRGSPLLAADLIKNLLFQIASTQDTDLESLYRDYWAPFDSDYWRTRVTQGRLTRPRVDVFLNYWLTMKLAKEIPTDRIFVEFRDSNIHSGRPISETMAELAQDAKVFARGRSAESMVAIARMAMSGSRSRRRRPTMRFLPPAP